MWLTKNVSFCNPPGHLSLLTSPFLNSSTELHCPIQGSRGRGWQGDRPEGGISRLRQSLSGTSLTPFLSLSQWQHRFLDSQTQPAPPEDKLQQGNSIKENCPSTSDRSESLSVSVAVSVLISYDVIQNRALHIVPAPQEKQFQSGLLNQLIMHCSHTLLIRGATNMLFCVVLFFLWITHSSFKPHGAPSLCMCKTKILNQKLLHDILNPPPLPKKSRVDGTTSGPLDVILLSSNWIQMPEILLP